MLWMLRSGVQWWVLPRCFGPWIGVFKHFARWCRLGVWDRLHSILAWDAEPHRVTPLRLASLQGAMPDGLPVRQGEVLPANRHTL
ncbi:transposase [Azotobacter vinelandii]|uniref:transposase n=1 Tax=Pseudomonadota TaxID=1224 RepID=UPI0012F4EC9A